MDQAAAKAERFARYCELRATGLRPVDAAREVGVEWYRTGQRYERQYRREQGLPPKEPKVPAAASHPYWASGADTASCDVRP